MPEVTNGAHMAREKGPCLFDPAPLRGWLGQELAVLSIHHAMPRCYFTCRAATGPSRVASRRAQKSNHMLVSKRADCTG